MPNYKDGVILFIGPSPEIARARDIIEDVYREHGVTLTVTSGADGKHGHGSKHNVPRRSEVPLQGYFDAMDFRTRDIQATGVDLKALRKEIADRVGSTYDVVLESDHLHVEFESRRK